MTLYENWIIYPDGERQEIQHTLRINGLVDINGFPLPLPLSQVKIIAYRVFRMSTKEDRGVVAKFYYLELVPMMELMCYVKSGSF